MKRKNRCVLIALIIAAILLAGCSLPVTKEKQDYALITLVSYNPNTSTVALSNSGDSTYEIFYTLDGSLPTSSSTQYTGPFTIAADTTLKAVTIRNGKVGDVRTEEYGAGSVSETEPAQTTVKRKAVTSTETDAVLLNSILGTWSAINEAGQTVGYIFAADGTLILINPAGNSQTTFTVTATTNSQGTVSYESTAFDQPVVYEAGSLSIDCEPPGDNAIFINGVSYIFTV